MSGPSSHRRDTTVQACSLLHSKVIPRLLPGMPALRMKGPTMAHALLLDIPKDRDDASSRSPTLSRA